MSKITSNLALIMKTDPNIKIKTEPGLGEGERLSSFKLPRDLTLGASQKNKRTFQPNLNIVRNKNKSDSNSPSTSSPNVARGGRERGRGRGEDNRGRGRGGRNSSRFIQSQGVFSEGIAETKHKSSHGWGGSRTSSKNDTHIEKPKLNVKQDIRIDKEEEDRKLSEIYKEKHSYNEFKPEGSFVPVKLPFREEQKTFPLPNNIGNIKIKKEDEMNNRENMNFFLNENNNKLIFFQFPESLPGFGKSEEPEQIKDSKLADKSINENESYNRCTLRDLDEGVVGKIVLYKSGKTKLIMGNTQFNIHLGVQQSFLQNIMSIKTDAEDREAHMINLGSIDGSLIVSPDWEHLLSQVS